MRFTILTPTYNRAHCLGRVYESLRVQTFQDFEWVVVDDGSTDRTRDLISSWKAGFPIRYVWKPNGGRHTAINTGVQMARGQFTAQLDSDDSLLPHALERIDYHWRQIEDQERFAIVVALCLREDGTVVGGRLPRDHVDVFGIGQLAALTDGGQWGTARTDILRKFPYPIFKNERFLTESVVWNRILRRHGARYVDEPLHIYRVTPDSLSRSGDHRWRSPKGAVLFHAELALSDAPFKMRLKSAVNALRFSAVAAARQLLPLTSVE
ncbi:MAG TPA: glycosyltransferase family 2 protein [Stellaceae bacterium]|nr:glycosyltransferase family 2 protein [Stellaceae bacterium]